MLRLVCAMAGVQGTHLCCWANKTERPLTGMLTTFLNRYIYVHIIYAYIYMFSNKYNTSYFWMNSPKSWRLMMEPILNSISFAFCLSPLWAEAKFGWVCGLQSPALQRFLKNCTWSNSSFCNSDMSSLLFPMHMHVPALTQKPNLTTV